MICELKKGQSWRQRIVACFFLLNICCYAQTVPSIQWAKYYGGSNDEEANCIVQIKDSGYIVAGWSNSIDDDITGHHGGDTTEDAWIVKLDKSGTIKWERSIGGSHSDYANAIRQTRDGGYIMAGQSVSTDGDVARSYVNGGYWLVKLDSSGAIQWSKCYGGRPEDVAQSIQQTSDGGYIAAGTCWDNLGDVTGNHGGTDYWVVKFNDTGSIQWEKSLGGSGNDNARSIEQTHDGGYIVVGESHSSDGEVVRDGDSGSVWIVKLSDTGAVQWQKVLGCDGHEVASRIHQTSDNGYIIAAMADSNGGDVLDHHGLSGIYSYDYWIIKLDSSGALLWEKCYGGSGDDDASDIQQTKDNGYIVTGTSDSRDGDVTGGTGYGNYWMLKIDTQGGIQWEETLGGIGDGEVAQSVQQTYEGGYIVAGMSGSNSYTSTGFHGGNEDYWIVKFASDTITEIEETTSIPSLMSLWNFPNPASKAITIYYNFSIEQNIALGIYDLYGRLIAPLENGLIAEGSHILKYDCSQLPSGLYFIRLQIPGEILSKQLMVVH